MSERADVCPECKSWNTERQATFRPRYAVEEVYTCDDCVTQYTVRYRIMDTETDYTENGE